MIARRQFLLDHRLARRVEPGQQHRRFHLGGRDGHAIGDRHRVLRADHGHRQPRAVAPDEARADRAQGLGDPAHRPPAQARVAGEDAGEGVRRHGPHQEPRAGAGIAEIEHVVGLRQAADAGAGDGPDAVAAALDAGPHRAQRRGRAQHVVALEQAGDARAPDRKRAQDEGAVRDRLVARHAAASGERARGVRDERHRPGMGHGSAHL